MSIRMVLRTIKNKDMGRSYNLKNSPINKGTAAKPSPMKEPITLAIAGAAASGLIGGGLNLIEGAKKKKDLKELQAQEKKSNIIKNMDAFNKDLTG